MPQQDGRTDFEFLVGTWRIRHRRLTERLKGANSWEEFEGRSVARQVLAGLGNLDEITMDQAAGRLHGITLRLYDPTSRQWSIHWADSAHGTLDSPMVGGFEAGRGEFFAQETFAGKRVFSSFIWSNITDASCRWEQALSADGGTTWETNWIMEFDRLA